MWRWRRELSPLAVAGALFLAPVLGRVVVPDLPWLPLPAGALGVAAVVLLGHRPIHRWYAAGSAVASLWAAAVWWVGPVDPVLIGAFIAIVVTACCVWFRHVHPRSRIAVPGGSSWPWNWSRWQFQRTQRREIREAMTSWSVASFWGRVPRSEIRAAAADIDDDRRLLTIELIPGHIGIDLDNRRAASAIGCPVASVRVVDQGPTTPANVVLIEWYYESLDIVREDGGEESADERPEPEQLKALRLEMLRVAIEQAGPQVMSARKLAKRANLPHDWVARHLPELAEALGLRPVPGGWQRLGLTAREA